MSTNKELANAIRFLAIDAIEKASSGHPGAPMGMADMAEVLWNEFLVHNPANPNWVNRDRFVLSNGHASMLLYAVLHLTGYDISIDDIKNFRQLHSKTPGHPELHLTPGIDMTSGPLGQGIAAAAGMALGEKLLAAEFNREEFPIIDHYTYTFLGDGCMMEGVASEACSLAGTLGLNKLIALWDDNGISIDGDVQGWFSENVPARFLAYGWNVIKDVDGHDAAAIKKAIAKAKKSTDKPTLICCKTTIGFGSPALAGTAKTHGSPLGEEEIEATRKALAWPYAPFEIPVEIKSEWDAKKEGKKNQAKWEALMEQYSQAFPDLAQELKRRLAGDLPANISKLLNDFAATVQKEGGALATRVSSKKVLDVIAPQTPELFGGSADLTGSVGTLWDGAQRITHEDFSGRYLSYGVREFAMAAMMNGLAVHGGIIPYAGTFLVFSDYLKPALRLSALMKQRVIHVLTHDSIMVGEDGPTHQPIEQISSLRLIPNVHVWRPADTVETAFAWQSALECATTPTCLTLSRQSLPTLTRDTDTFDAIKRGGYIIRKAKKTIPDALLIATGSEVSLALATADVLAKRDIDVQVVSMPCAEIFDKQDRTWKETVLPFAVKARVAIEAGASEGWYKYVGLEGAVVGIDSFGESAPGNAVYQYFGFTPDHVASVVRTTLTGCQLSAEE